MRLQFIVFALVLAALPAAADPDVPELARRLASEDPRVRAAARAELLRQKEEIAPALREAAAKEEDGEARLALVEIAERLEEARPLAYAKDWAWKVVTNEMTLDEVKAWRISPIRVFLCCHKYADEIAESLPGRFDGWRDQGPTSAQLVQAATHWLRVYTLADIGKDVAAWTEFEEKTRGMSWEEVRLEGLEQRGFRVREADPDVVAAEFLLAGRAGSGELPGRTVRPVRGQSPETAESFALLIARYFKDCPHVSREDMDLDAALDWIEACGRTFWRKGSRIVSHAGADDFVAATRSEREGVVLAGLTQLERWPDRVPPECWSRLEANPWLVMRVMSKAGHVAPRERLPAVLRAMGRDADPGVVRGIWSAGDLSALALDSSSDPNDRERALLCLSRIDPAAGGRCALEVLAAYKAEDGFQGHVVARAAAIAAVEQGTADGLDSAESWLKLAPENYERIDVAIALARKGRRAGFDIVIDRLKRDLVDRRRCAKVREFIEGAPEKFRDDLWPAWARDNAHRYQWDSNAKKWRADR